MKNRQEYGGWCVHHRVDDERSIGGVEVWRSEKK